MTADADSARGRARGRMRASWRLLTGTGAGASAALGLLVVGCVFLAVAGPRASLLLRTRALHQLTAAAPPGSQAVTAAIDSYTFNPPGVPVTPAEVMSVRLLIGGYLSGHGLPVRTGQAWSNVASGYLTVPDAAPSARIASHPPQLQLVWRDALRHYARLAAGRWPASARRSGTSLTFQVAVTRATAARFGLHPGSRLSLGAGLAISVTGLLSPAAPRSAFWTEFAGAAAPETFTEPPPLSQAYWQGAVFIGPGELAPLQASNGHADVNLDWVFPLSLAGMTADQAGPLAGLAAAEAGGAAIVGSGGGLSLTTGAASELAAFISADRAVSGILALLEVSLVALGAAVLLLCARLLTQQRAAEYALMRARGAGRRQVSWRALRGGAVVVIPAAVAAAAAAVAATPGSGIPLAWWLAGLVTVTALAGPPLLAAVAGAPRRRVRPGGAAAARRLAAARRWVADGTLVCLAAGGLIVLRAQGPAAAGGDAYTSAGPVLAAVPAAVLAARLGPVAVRGLLRLARRRGGVVTFIGLARGAATGSVAALPVFALVLALALVAFSGMVRAGARAGDTAVSWQQVPASAVVGGPADSIALTTKAQRAIAAVPGAGPVAGIRQATGDLPGARFGAAELTVVIVDPRQYAAVLAATPAGRFPAAALARPRRPGGPAPVLASPRAAAFLGASPALVSLGTGTVTIKVAGRLASTPAAAGAAGPFVVLPLWAAGAQLQLPPTMMLVGGSQVSEPALAAAAARTAPGVPVTFRTRVLARLENAPLPRAADAAFAAGTAAAAGFCALVLVIMLVLGGRGRELMLARLATMGLHPAQARELAAAEVVPPVIAAVAGGVACALALVPLLGPAISLSAFTGSAAAVALHADLGVLATVAGGLVLLAAAVLAAQGMAAARRGTGRALRIDE